MEIILKILTLYYTYCIFYNIRQRKKYDEWNEKKNQAIYMIWGQILACDREQAKFVMDGFNSGHHAVPIDAVVEPMSVVSIHGGESMYGHAFRL